MPAPSIGNLLRCPISGDNLRTVAGEDLVRLRADIDAKHLVQLDGSPAKSSFDGFLRAHDSAIYYPVQQGVFILLPDCAMVTAAQRKTYEVHLMPAATRAVMGFYDQIGWRKTDRGVFHDADINEDFRQVSRNYIHMCHLRVNDYLPHGGKYLLDVASGPIQYDEYLTYSANFERRICCDVSLGALRAAALRLGTNGIYIQGDITNLPLKDGVVDGFVSLHTIYHVPAEMQILAFQELERVTRNGGGGVAVYTWGRHSWGTKIAAPWRAFAAMPARMRTMLRPFIPDALIKWLKRGTVPTGAETNFVGNYAASQYSFHAYDFHWYSENIAASRRWSLRVWRSVSLHFLKSYIPDNAVGRLLLVFIYTVENLCPNVFGRIGTYPMFVFKKPATTN